MTDGELPFQLSVQELDRLRKAGEPLAILDVREPWEVEVCRIEGSLAIPMGAIPDQVEQLPRDITLVVVCHHGMRSAHVTAWLRQQGFANAINLQGGIDAWASVVDPDMSRY